MARIPEGLRRKLEREAEQNRRSLNAELIHRLTQSFVHQDQKDLVAATVRQTLASVHQTLASMQAQTPLALALETATQQQPAEPKPTIETEKPKQGE